MATNTPNLNLVKPALDDFYDINVFNKNMDAIDTAINDLQDVSNSMQAKEVPQGVTDLNLITETGFYEVDDITYTNVPENYTASGLTYMMESFVLEVYAQPNGTIMQRATEVSGNGSHYRFKFNGQDTWSAWIGEDKRFLMQSEQIPSGVTDLDQITEAGFYELSSATTYSNIPTDVSDGMLIVYMHKNGIGLQKLISAMGDKTYYRTKPNILANWNQWIEEGSGGSGDDKLPLTGGTVTGETTFQKGINISSTQPSAPTKGDVIVNSDNSNLQYYTGNAWANVLSTGLNYNALKTTDKSILGSINELFQSVSNGKAALATVIGGVASTASFEELKNKITQDKQAAINIFTQKGVQVPPDATLEQIVASISQVGGTAEGRIMLDQTGRATITGLGFTPKLIHVRGSYSMTSYYSFMADPTQVSHRFLYISSYPYDQYNFQVELVTGDVINNIVNGGFSVNFNSRLTNQEIEWKASG